MAFLRPPELIQTERLSLRPLAASDAAVVFHGYASSPAATRFMNFPRHTSIEQSIAFAERCERCWESDGAYPWAIIEKTTGNFIGSFELRTNPPRADFGYILCEQHWGKGFATEAARAVVDWAFAQPEIYRVWATCFVENNASARVLEKSGLALEATLENWEARPQLGAPTGPSLLYSTIKRLSLP